MHGLTMPKWGLSMTEGRIVAWLVDEGAAVGPGVAVVEVETDKALSPVEASASGLLRRKVAREGDVVPVAGLLAVIADAAVPDAEIDRFAADSIARSVGCVESSRPTGADGVDLVGLEDSTHPTRTQTVMVRGQPLRYLARGQGGAPAILIHGFGGDFNTWLLNHQPLARQRAVYALDLPGHGGSSKQVGAGTLCELAETLQGFMDAVGLSEAHLVGHSMGGAVALELALAHPQRCRSLALLASAGLGWEIDREFIDGFITANRRKELKPHLDKLFADPRLAGRQLIEEVLKYKRLDGVEPALRTIAGQLCPGGRQAVVLRDRLSQLAMPILVIWGAEDRILPASQAQGLPGNVRTEILPGIGHMVQMEATAQVNQLIGSFWGDN